VLRYSVGEPGNHSALTAMAYSAGWNATDQIPHRAVDQGRVGRYGAIDPSDGGNTSRYSLSLETDAGWPTVASSSTPTRSSRG